MTSISRRTALKLAAGAPFAASMLGAGRALAATPFPVLIPSVELVGYGELYLPIVDGGYEAGGLDVTVMPAQGSAMALTQVIAGQAKLCRCGSVDVMNAAVKQGAPIVAVANNMPRSPMWVISPASAPIAGPADFEGKTIGVVSFGGFSENALDMIAAQAGMEPGSVAREAVGNAPGAYSLIEQGRIDAFIASTSTVMALQNDGIEITAWNTFDHLPIPGQVYAVHRDTIENQPEELRAFLAAVHAGMEKIFDAEDNLLPIVESFAPFNMLDAKDPAVGAAALKAELPAWAANGRENLMVNMPEQWEECRTAMIAAGLLDEGASVEGIFTNDFLPTA